MAKLHRKHRGDGGRRTALQQQNDLCGHAAEAQQPEHRQADGGDQQHAHGGQLPHRLAAHDAAQVPGGKEHAGDDHGKGCGHVGHQLQRLGDELRHRDLQQVDAKADHHGVQHRCVQQAVQDLFGVGTPTHKAVAHGPQQNVEHGHIGAGIEQTLGPEQRRDERKTHVRRIGKNAGEPEDGGTAVLAAGGEGQRDAGTDEQGQQAHPKGGQQVVQNFHTELHTVGVHDHGGHHQIDQQVGKGLLALRFEHAGFHSGDAGAHEQKQHDDLTGRDLCEFHCGFLLLRCI